MDEADCTHLKPSWDGRLSMTGLRLRNDLQVSAAVGSSCLRGEASQSH